MRTKKITVEQIQNLNNAGKANDNKQKKTGKFGFENDKIFKKLTEIQHIKEEERDNQEIKENNENGENDANENKNQKEIKPKKKANRLKLDEKHMLFSEKGLKYLFQNLEETNFNSNDDKLNLDSFMKHIKTWHFLLHRKYEFSFFLSKIRDLGTKPAVKVSI